MAAMSTALAIPAAAQLGTAEIGGRVLDAAGGRLPGTAVVLRNQETGMRRQAVSNEDGAYFLSGMTPGLYEVSATRPGFKKYSRSGLRLEVGRTATVDLRLEIGGREEQVTVSSETSPVDVTSKEVGGNITARELTDLPSINRNFTGFIGLLPGVVPRIATDSFAADSITVNGQDSRNNNFLLDGANNNDDVAGGRGGTQVRPPLEAVQEFQVLTSQFDAEFSRTAGAVVNAITKQGTNAFHGSAFAFVQDAWLTQKDFFTRQNGLPKPDTTFQQYGFTVGGPIVKDKAHFFASVERVVIDAAHPIEIPSRPDLDATPTTDTRVWNTLVRLDQQVTAGLTWSLRWLRERAPQRNEIVPIEGLPVVLAAARAEEDTDQTIVTTLSSSVGNTRFNTLRLAFTGEDVVTASAGFISNGRRQDLLPPTLRHLGYVDQQSNAADVRRDRAWQAEDTFSWFVPGQAGDHDLRLGAQYEYVRAGVEAHGNLNGTFAFNTDRPFDAADPRTYPEQLTIRVPGPSVLTMKAHQLGAFAQDKWKVGRRLTLSLGVRYDLEVIPLRERDNPRFPDPSDYPVDHNNLAPRVGFAFDPRGDGRTALRGGYGRFFDRTFFELISSVLTSGVFSDSFLVSFTDRGPSRGELPTDPLLRNGPVVDRTLLAQLIAPGTSARNTGVVSLDNPMRRVPYADHVSIGFERAFGRALAATVDYVHAFGRDQFMSRDLNPGVRVDTTRTGRVVRVDPAFVSSVFMRVNTGRTDYDALLLQVERRWTGSHRFRVAYTLSSSRGNTGAVFPIGGNMGISPFQYLDDMRLDANQGPTNVDRRHNFVLSGSAEVPRTGGLTVGAVVRALSGLPFTIQDTGVDADRNGVLFDPLPAGVYSGTGRNSFTVENAGGRAGARGPSFFQTDLRVGYRFGLGQRRLNVFAEVFNLTNRANFDVSATPAAAGDRRSTSFLIYTALRDGAVPRTGQLGVRFAF
jgi:hypothetical protein